VVAVSLIEVLVLKVKRAANTMASDRFIR
jgi:hypothetical protein